MALSKGRQWEKLPLSASCASPLILKYETPAGNLYVGNDGPIQTERPGNGGLRLSTYGDEKAAIQECIALSSGMTGKHLVYNTGFSGAKLVCNCKDLKRVNKRELMQHVAAALKELNGAVYTGCDVNTSLQDMETLMSMCPYVLSSIDSAVDPNVATAYGVFGSIQGALDTEGGIRGKAFFVKGVGKVGSTVAALLVQAGAKRVLTADLDAARARLPGCTDVSAQDWRQVECDVLVPCAASGFLDTEAALALTCRVIVGATNVPFKSPEARSALESRGVRFVPESVSSAGAVLADSIEFHEPKEYRTARPATVYAFVRATTRNKTRQLVAASITAGKPLSEVVALVMEDSKGPRAGALFTAWKEVNTEHFDVAIVGAGVAGAATVYYLSRDAPILRTVVVEADTVAHHAGSSYGESRMYRRMYSEQYFSAMQDAALRLWRQLEEEHGVALLRPHGLLFWGDPGVGDTVQGGLRDAREVMDRGGVPYEHLDASALTQRWPIAEAQEGWEGLLEPDAGAVRAGVAVQTLMAGAQSRGVTLREGEAVEDMAVVGPDRVELVTSQNRIIVARRAVLCCGAWTNELLGQLGAAPLNLQVWAMHWGHYEVDASLAAAFPQWYCFRGAERGGVREGPWRDEGLYYGFPPEPGTNVIKVGIDFTADAPGFRAASPRGVVRSPDPAALQLLDSFLRRHWRGIGRRLDCHISPYTMTYDNHFVLDRLPEHPREVCVFTGGCGRAFKFAPLIGRCLADLALGRAPSHDITPLRATREAVRPGTQTPRL